MAPRKKTQAAGAASAPNLAELLSKAVAALQTNTPLMATHAEMEPLVKYDGGHLVECNEAVKDGDKVAWRASARGVEAQNAGWLSGTPANAGPAAGFTAPTNSGANTAPAGSADAGKTFVFDDDIPIPAPRRGGRGSNTYGFEHMNVGQSFFIAATTDNPNPSKRVASTVSSATKRLAPKSFIVRSVDETDKGRGKGARVYRTA